MENEQIIVLEKVKIQKFYKENIASYQGFHFKKYYLKYSCPKMIPPDILTCSFLLNNMFEKQHVK